MSTSTETLDNVDVPHLVVYFVDTGITQIQLSRRLLGDADFNAVVKAAKSGVYGFVEKATVKGKKLYLNLPDPLDPVTHSMVSMTLKWIKETISTYIKPRSSPSRHDSGTHRRSRAGNERARRIRRKTKAQLAVFVRK